MNPIFIFELIVGLFIFAFGLAIGSFLNVVIYRTENNISFVRGRSMCTSCGHTLVAKDLIPVFSWITLGGKCRYCKEKISLRYPVIELLTALTYVFAYITIGLEFKLIIALLLFPVLICLSMVDLDKGEIPYWCSIFIGVLGLIMFIKSFFAPEGIIWYEHLIGAFIIAVPFAVFAFLGAMGGGDMQLMAAAGFLLGWSVVPAAFIGIVLGAVAGIIVKISKKSATIPFGPFLSVGIMFGFIYGKDIIEWYLKLIHVA